MAMTDSEKFEGWCIVEQLGHKRLAGYVSEQVVGGTAFIRVDVPGPDGKPVATQFLSGGSIYAITPCTEDLARKVALNCIVQPVTEWDIRRPALPGASTFHTDDEDDYDDDGAEVDAP